MLEDGSTVLAGSTNGDWNAANAGDDDFAACKLDVDGTLLWKWQVTEGWCLIDVRPPEHSRQ